MFIDSIQFFAHLAMTKRAKTILFFKFFWRRHVLFWGNCYPCFRFPMTSHLGLKARKGSALFTFCGGECNVHSPRSTSSATVANLLVAGAQPVTSKHDCAEMGLVSDLNGNHLYNPHLSVCCCLRRRMDMS